MRERYYNSMLKVTRLVDFGIYILILGHQRTVIIFFELSSATTPSAIQQKENFFSLLLIDEESWLLRHTAGSSSFHEKMIGAAPFFKQVLQLIKSFNSSY